MRIPRRGWFLAGAFLLLFALQEGVAPTGSDPKARLWLTHRLLDHGQVHSPQNDTGRLLHTQRGYTSYFAIGQSLLFVPFDLVGKALGGVLPTVGPVAPRDIPVSYLFLPLVGSLYLLALLLVFEELGLSPSAAMGGALVFTASTIALEYLVHTYQEEACAMASLCLSLLFALRFRKQSSSWNAFLTGIFAGVAMMFRFNAPFGLLTIAAVFIAGLRRETVRRIVPAILGAAGPLAIICLFAYWRFGSPFSTGYDLRPREELVMPFQWRIVWLLLFGLGKGFFVLSPPLLVAFWGSIVSWRKAAVLSIFPWLSLLSSAIFCGALYAPEGSWSWGARYQVHLLPLFAYPAWRGWEDLRHRALGRRLAVGLIVLGLLLRAGALLLPEEAEYLQMRDSTGPSTWEVLMGNGSGGQLWQRARNVAHGLHIAREPQREGVDNALFDFWGPNLARLTVHSEKRAIVVLVWLAILSLGLLASWRAVTFAVD